ncbi:serine hydrolase domain-containing protein [Robertkochia flava]|uniref:serine hydrolase domain-containing protein n=1 Tax=Robertkochia flava TaxID=3447986 RepID=UPI001CCEAEFE|nr:serine hydrolase domain-containing protein [Robertkochia marina]
MKTLIKCIAFAGIILLSCYACKENTSGNTMAELDLPETSELERTADSLFQTAIDSSMLAGGEVLVYKDGDTLLRKTYGKASIELDVPMPKNAVYEIASVTKQFTAAAILKLAEEGKLSLDDPMTKYIDFDTQGYDVRIHHLLNHTSGIFQVKMLPDFWNIVQRPFTQDSIIAMIEKQGMMFPSGEAQFYNDSAYQILGLIIEKISGKSYEDYLDDTFFTPLGMDNTNYCSNDRIEPNKVYGYDYKDSKLIKHMRVDHSWPYSAGSLCSTAEDLLLWMKALHNGKVFSPAMYQKMISPKEIQGWRQLRYAYGLHVSKDGGISLIGHGGGIPGYSTEAYFFPDHQLYVIVLLNSIGADELNLIYKKLAFSALDPSVVEEPRHKPLSKKFEGMYTGSLDAGPKKIQLKSIDEGLRLTYPKNDFTISLTDYRGNDTWENTEWRERVRFRGDTLEIDYGAGNYILIKDKTANEESKTK